ncbi:hypothetical protein ACO0LM_20075 [Undibacterium sp. Di26W]|uniref:hypothetical protein n=1 Tax=Undibacterium sp. Di26W TaxID=3413035 RepID=UPI003BF1D1F7
MTRATGLAVQKHKPSRGNFLKRAKNIFSTIPDVAEYLFAKSAPREHALFSVLYAFIPKKYTETL